MGLQIPLLRPRKTSLVELSQQSVYFTYLLTECLELRFAVLLLFVLVEGRVINNLIAFDVSSARSSLRPILLRCSPHIRRSVVTYAFGGR